MNTVSKRVDWIIEKAQRLGYSCDYRYAQTGTCYITCECLVDDGMDCITKTIRVADHADAYGTSDYTADDCEGTDKGAVEFLAELVGKTYRDSFKKTVRHNYALVVEGWSKGFCTIESAKKEQALHTDSSWDGLELVKLNRGKLSNGSKPTFCE